jgi:uncharacterized protein YndB with AHSA1/START domain
MNLTGIPYHEVLEREIVLTRVIAAEKKIVFEAFTTQAALDEWFGPAGFTTVTSEYEFRVGGRWRFEFKSPEGTLYGNRIEYLEITPFDKIVFNHGADRDNDPGRFFVTITFDEQQNKKTVVTLRQLHPTKEQRAGGMGFGAVEFGMQTLDKLAAFVAKKQ